MAVVQDRSEDYRTSQEIELDSRQTLRAWAALCVGIITISVVVVSFVICRQAINKTRNDTAHVAMMERQADAQEALVAELTMARMGEKAYRGAAVMTDKEFAQARIDWAEMHGQRQDPCGAGSTPDKCLEATAKQGFNTK